MKNILTAIAVTAFVIVATGVVFLPEWVPAMAAPSAKEPEPEKCPLVAQAGGIEVYYCENIHLFVNQLGFMAFEP